MAVATQSALAQYPLLLLKNLSQMLRSTKLLTHVSCFMECHLAAGSLRIGDWNALYWYLRQLWRCELVQKCQYVACGPVHILTLITGLALLRTLAWLLADTSPPTVPVSRRNDAVHCGPVRPCAFCSDPALMAQALTVQAPPTVISAYCARSQNMTIGGATKFLGGQQLLVTILNLLILPMPTMLPSSCLTWHRRLVLFSHLIPSQNIMG